MIDFPPELGADNGREDLGQDPHPGLLMHNVESLQPLPHGARQHMVGLQKPAPARPVLLGGDRAIAVACKEDDLVFVALQQVVLLRQACEDIGKQLVEVGVVCVWKGSSIENEHGPSFLGGNGAAVENGSSGLGQVD